MRRSIPALLLACSLISAAQAGAQTPVAYRISIPEPQHHWMQVEVTFPDLPPGPLEVMMSRTSPGRYAIHEFAKYVYDVHIDNGGGNALSVERPNPSQWDVWGHVGTVRVRYRVFGDQVDGTFLAVDATHAHINVPAALMWARGLEGRAVQVTLQPPQGTAWKVATQLHPTGDPYTFTAANLQYLIDSPIEVSNFTLRSFSVPEVFRIALHHDGTEQEVDRLTADVERIVREERAIFGEFPKFENPYTFIADFLPYAHRDGMEHRNSTVMTGAGPLRVPDQRFDILSTVAHEFFHSWNVERIRPASLEPFRLDSANPSGELWFAEGFTSYYEPLVLRRTGLSTLQQFAGALAYVLDTVIRSPGRKYRSAVEMSGMAEYVDAASWSDRTNWSNSYISYYTWGAAIAAGLDLSLRARSDGKVTLDDLMKSMWRDYGSVPAGAEGTVARPYTLRDLRDRLAAVARDEKFANDFFDRYVQGRDVPEYAALLQRAGLILRKRHPGTAWLGPVILDFAAEVPVIAEPTIEDTPAHRAGLNRGDELVSIDGARVLSAGGLAEIVTRKKPNDQLRITIRRRGLVENVIATLQEDPQLEVVPAEAAGLALSAGQRAFREAWLGSR